MSRSIGLVLLPVVLFSAVFFVLFYSTWQKQRVDIVRHLLFTIRDELFIIFAKSDLTVDHPAHRALRHSLNRMIRYAHRITWFRILLHVRYANIKASGDMQAAMCAIKSHDIYDDVRRCIQESYGALMMMMISRSLPLIALRGLVIAVTRLHRSWHEARDEYVDNAADSILIAAEQEEVIIRHTLKSAA